VELKSGDVRQPFQKQINEGFLFCKMKRKL